MDRALIRLLLVILAVVLAVVWLLAVAVVKFPLPAWIPPSGLIALAAAALL